MAAPADYLDSVDLQDIDADGFLNEDFIQKIYDSSVGIKPILLPRLTTVPISNSYKSWAQDELEDPTDSRVVSGADASNDTSSLTNAIRLGNHTQINRKVVNTTTRSREVSSVTGDVLEYRTNRKIMELQRDMEAHLLGVVGSVEDDNDTVAGRTASIGSWLTTNVSFGTDGLPGGFDTSTKLVDSISSGGERSITLDMIREIVEGIYLNGGAANGELTLMSTPVVIKAISEAVRTDSTGNFIVPRANVSGEGKGTDQTAQGWTDIIYTDFGIRLVLTSNRLQLPYNGGDGLGTPTVPTGNDAAGTHAALFFLDMEFLAKGFLHDIRVEPLAKVGLSDKRQVSVDWMSLMLLERAMGAIYDIDVSAVFA